MADRILLPIIRRARAGSAIDQLALGRHYLIGGNGVGKNLAAATMWLLRSFSGGDRAAAKLLAEEVPAAQCGDLAVFEHACNVAIEDGSLRAAYVLVEQREARGLAGVDDFIAIARSGEPHAARRAGELLLMQGRVEESIHWLTQSAEGGDHAAIHLLTNVHINANDARLDALLPRAAEAGHAEAQFRLGNDLLLENTPASRREGRVFLHKAADQGHAQALWRLGQDYAGSILNKTNFGLSNLPARAVPLLRRAAAAGVVEAWWDLAQILAYPQFPGRNLILARAALECAAHENIAAAQRALGEQLATRRREITTWLSAGRWLTAALEGGELSAMDTLLTISEAAHPAAKDTTHLHDAALAAIAVKYPAVAARLSLAAAFDLTERETLFLDISRADQGWCFLADTSKYFKNKSWRLVRMEHLYQRSVLNAALAAFNLPDVVNGDLSGAIRTRAPKLATLLVQFGIEPAIFFKS